MEHKLPDWVVENIMMSLKTNKDIAKKHFEYDRNTGKTTVKGYLQITIKEIFMEYCKLEIQLMDYKNDIPLFIWEVPDEMGLKQGDAVTLKPIKFSTDFTLE
jgi:hypothetical protein